MYGFQADTLVRTTSVVEVDASDTLDEANNLLILIRMAEDEVNGQWMGGGYMIT